MIDIHFEDSSTKKFVVSPDTTVAELLRRIEQKMHLNTDLESFALFESRTSRGKQIVPLFSSFLVFISLILDCYLNPNDKCPRVSPPSYLLFKKRFFFQESTNPDNIHMEFIQVTQLPLTIFHFFPFQIREDVLRGHYSLSERETLQLGAIDLRITYGRPSAEKHRPGFLTFVSLVFVFIFTLLVQVIFSPVIFHSTYSRKKRKVPGRSSY